MIVIVIGKGIVAKSAASFMDLAFKFLATNKFINFTNLLSKQKTICTIKPKTDGSTSIVAWPADR